jgi:plastocyanin
MRKFIVFFAVAAVMAIPAQALAANITISTVGFVPASLTINQGDTVTWTNTDLATHQVVSKKAGLSSPMLATGQTFSFAFTKAGNFAFEDASAKKVNGTIVVKAAPKAAVNAAAVSAASMTLKASTLQVVYGARVTLSGTLASKQAGEKVTVLAQPYGEPSFKTLTTVTTGTGGAWSYVAKPTIRTAYEGRWKTVTGPATTVGVRPLVSLRLITGQRFATKVVAGRSLVGRSVQLQRKSPFGQWVTVKRTKLNASSTAIFRAALLPRGKSTLRVAISVNQAGAGYLGGMSRTIAYTR